MRLLSLFLAAAMTQLMGQSAPSGQQLFALHCSVGYCHGVGGSAGRGPRLRGRDWDRGYLAKVIENGVAGTAMPGWKGKLSQEQIASVVSYILSISHETGAVTQSETVASHELSSNGLLGPEAARGKELFFDPGNDRNCGVCHGLRDRGPGIGPALVSLRDTQSKKSNPEVLAAILNPTSLNQSLRIRTASGETICGIKAGENGRDLQIYDLASTGPPVLRTLRVEEISERGHCDQLNVHAGFANFYTSQELSDIVVFLKSGLRFR